MVHLIPYTAAPDDSCFRAVSIADLEEILALIDDSERSSSDTEWATAAYECDREACTKALELARAGQTVFIAQDDDGYYFAIEVEA